MAKRARKKAARGGSTKRASTTTTRKRTAKKADRKHGRNVRKATLNDFAGNLKRFAAASKREGAEQGACLIPDPAGGPMMCVVTDRETCKAAKGKFLGGPC